jgi:lipopolysaccharide transport system permease protein
MKVKQTINNSSTQEKWLLEITPQRSLFDFNLKELWQYKDLIWVFVRRDFVSKYKQTILGPIWFLIQPILSTAMFYIIFSKVANLSTDGVPPLLFYLSGIVCWTYFSQSLTMTANTFVSNAGIFGKVYFPRLSVPVSVVISNLAGFFIQFSLLFLFIVIYYVKDHSVRPTIWLLTLPLLVLIMAGLGLGLGIIISALTTKYRDLAHLVGFGVQLWMYASPVAYPVSSLTGTLKTLILLNPVTPIIEAFRYITMGVGSVEFNYLLYSFGFTVFVLLLGILIFNRVEKNFMDTV